MKTTKKLLAILISVIMIFGTMCLAVSAEDSTVYIISGTVNVTVNTPIAGEKPSIDFTTDGKNYTVTAFTWYDKNTGAILDPAGTDFVYADGGEYTAKITLAPNDGCAFADDISVTINGNAPTAMSFDDGSVTVEYTFSCDKGAGHSFLSGVKSVLLTILRIFRDLVSNIIGF